MAKRYRVTLTAVERDEHRRMIARGKADAREPAHARVLLQADEADGGPGQVDGTISAAVRGERAHDQAGAPAVGGAGAGGGAAARPSRGSTGASWTGSRKPISSPWPAPAARGQEALVAAPAGRAHGGAGARGHALARDGAPDAQKNELKPHLGKTWCIPRSSRRTRLPHGGCTRGLPPAPRPQVPGRVPGRSFTRLIGESREPLPAARAGGTVRLRVRAQQAPPARPSPRAADERPAAAVQYAALLEGRYAEAEKLVLVMDRLDTHSPASLYRPSRPSGPSAWPTGSGSTTRTGARLVAEHGRDRARRARPPPAEAGGRQAGAGAPRDGVGAGPERRALSADWRLHHRRRPGLPASSTRQLMPDGVLRACPQSSQMAAAARWIAPGRWTARSSWRVANGPVLLQLGEEALDQVTGLVEVLRRKGAAPCGWPGRVTASLAGLLQGSEHAPLGVEGLVRDQRVRGQARQQGAGAPSRSWAWPGEGAKPVGPPRARRPGRGAWRSGRPGCARSPRPRDPPFCAGAVLAGADDRAVDHRVPVAGVAGRVPQNPLPHAGLGPAAGAGVGPLPDADRSGGPRRRMFRPAAVEHGLDEQPVVLRRDPDVPRPTGQRVLDPVPLLVPQRVAARRSAPPRATDPEPLTRPPGPLIEDTPQPLSTTNGRDERWPSRHRRAPGRTSGPGAGRVTATGRTRPGSHARAAPLPVPPQDRPNVRRRSAGWRLPLRATRLDQRPAPPASRPSTPSPPRARHFAVRDGNGVQTLTGLNARQKSERLGDRDPGRRAVPGRLA